MSTAIDLRSDTVTKPTAAMRAAMARAEVGDDVMAEDPTVNRLQERVADYFGMEAALFVPSGTMANQIAIRLHTAPGDELICEVGSHVYVWEAGGPAVLSGVTCRTLEGDYGLLHASQFEGLIRPSNEHYTRSRLVCLENTHNRGGGRVYSLEQTRAIGAWARTNGLRMHLDGARLWNALVAAGTSGREWGKLFDTISVCFSKGLGAPVGSCLVGSTEDMKRAHRIRKLFGGAMRQAGIVAAGALFALENHVERLADDHRHARIIGQAIGDCHGLQLSPPEIQTNLIWFEVDPEIGTGRDVVNHLREYGVLTSCLGPQVVRACTHLDVSPIQAEQAAEAIRQAMRQPLNRATAAGSD